MLGAQTSLLLRPICKPCGKVFVPLALYCVLRASTVENFHFNQPAHSPAVVEVKSDLAVALRYWISNTALKD
ncbi:hypothetical protein LY78DRAFT_392256 [Colletotrichum sublineola]|nr:hypothetical protein LY78DRAFT_392256 [Colletotrichum sublineola]